MLNEEIFFLIFNLSNRNPYLDQLMIFGAKYLIYITGFFTFLWIFSVKSELKKRALMLGLCLILSWAVVELIKFVFYIPRPFLTYQLIPLIDHPSDSTFPSFHTTTMAVLALIFILFKSKLSPLILGMMFWVGISRVFVGVHYPLDILGGMVVGFSSTFLIYYLAKKFLIISRFSVLGGI